MWQCIRTKQFLFAQIKIPYDAVIFVIQITPIAFTGGKKDVLFGHFPDFAGKEGCTE